MQGGITVKLEGKRFLVVGAGKSGIAAMELLKGQGYPVILYDGNGDRKSVV